MDHPSKPASHLACIREADYLRFFDGKLFSIRVERKNGSSEGQVREKDAICKEAILKGAKQHTEAEATRMKSNNAICRIQWIWFVDES